MVAPLLHQVYLQPFVSTVQHFTDQLGVEVAPAPVQCTTLAAALHHKAKCRCLLLRGVGEDARDLELTVELKIRGAGVDGVSGGMAPGLEGSATNP